MGGPILTQGFRGLHLCCFESMVKWCIMVGAHHEAKLLTLWGKERHTGRQENKNVCVFATLIKGIL